MNSRNSRRRPRSQERERVSILGTEHGAAGETGGREREDQDRWRMEGEYSSPKAGQWVGVETGLIPGRSGI